ncbi:hypothetical protein WG66_002497 [Moniliophthora roreri]|nr:hypothetical protein WG66_002497 [Moniliophthora roreri]
MPHFHDYSAPGVAGGAACNGSNPSSDNSRAARRALNYCRRNLKLSVPDQDGDRVGESRWSMPAIVLATISSRRLCDDTELIHPSVAASPPRRDVRTFGDGSHSRVLLQGRWVCALHLARIRVCSPFIVAIRYETSSRDYSDSAQRLNYYISVPTSFEISSSRFGLILRSYAALVPTYKGITFEKIPSLWRYDGSKIQLESASSALYKGVSMLDSVWYRFSGLASFDTVTKQKTFEPLIGSFGVQGSFESDSGSMKNFPVLRECNSQQDSFAQNFGFCSDYAFYSPPSSPKQLETADTQLKLPNLPILLPLIQTLLLVLFLIKLTS